MSRKDRRCRCPYPAISCLGAFFGRRPLERVDGCVIPASKNLHIRPTHRNMIGAKKIKTTSRRLFS